MLNMPNNKNLEYDLRMVFVPIHLTKPYSKDASRCSQSAAVHMLHAEF